VKSLPDEPTLSISLTLAGRQRNLERPKDELLEKPLSRIQKSAVGKPDKKQQRTKQPPGAAAQGANAPATELFVGLHEGPSVDHPLMDPATTTNAAAWRAGRLLRVGDLSFTVDFNPPMVRSIDVHGAGFVGIPLVPRVDVSVSRCSLVCCRT
jgi:hypothetical protein